MTTMHAVSFTTEVECTITPVRANLFSSTHLRCASARLFDLGGGKTGNSRGFFGSITGLREDKMRGPELFTPAEPAIGNFASLVGDARSRCGREVGLPDSLLQQRVRFLFTLSPRSRGPRPVGR